MAHDAAVAIGERQLKGRTHVAPRTPLRLHDRGLPHRRPEIPRQSATGHEVVPSLRIAIITRFRDGLKTDETAVTAIPAVQIGGDEMIAIARLPHNDRTPGNQSELHTHTNVLRADECIEPLHLHESDRADSEQRIGAHDALQRKDRHDGAGRIRPDALPREQHTQGIRAMRFARERGTDEP